MCDDEPGYTAVKSLREKVLCVIVEKRDVKYNPLVSGLVCDVSKHYQSFVVS